MGNQTQWYFQLPLNHTEPDVNTVPNPHHIRVHFVPSQPRGTEEPQSESKLFLGIMLCNNIVILIENKIKQNNSKHLKKQYPTLNKLHKIISTVPRKNRILIFQLIL